MAAIKLPRLPVNWKTQPQLLERYWDEAMKAIEAQLNSLTDTINRIKRLNSHTVPTTILKATENGSTVTIEVIAHTRVYGDGTMLAISGSPTAGTGLLGNTQYACYYDDDTLTNTTPVFHFTTTLSDAAPAKEDGRHSCGIILTPVLSSGDVIEAGGAYPGGSAPVGGELA